MNFYLVWKWKQSDQTLSWLLSFLKPRTQMTQNPAWVVMVPQKIQSCVAVMTNLIKHLSFRNYFYCSPLLVANISLLPHPWSLRDSSYMGNEQEMLRQKELDPTVECPTSAAALSSCPLSFLLHASFCLHPRSLSTHCQSLSVNAKQGINETAQ